ncbi:MAG: archease [Acidobacteriaceae bacterium]|nr:archease [Acidobacteriaceae bacterium]MBV9779594.1 archease [Acidobacteriaceae bacterium]
MKFELLEHPADIGFRARGRSLEGLFANCAYALVSIILDPCAIQVAAEIAVEATGSDYESLLVNFLNEVLYYVDGKGIALGRFDVGRLDPAHVRCIAGGEPRNPEMHPPRVVVKAVTYHQLKVARDETGWVAEVYVDV